MSTSNQLLLSQSRTIDVATVVFTGSEKKRKNLAQIHFIYIKGFGFELKFLELPVQ